MTPENLEHHCKTCSYLRTIGRLSFLLVLCPFPGSMFAHAQRYVEISAEIETITYQSGVTNDAAGEVHRTISVVCTVGTNEWRIDNTFSKNSNVSWFFDGTNVYDSSQITKPLSTPTKERTAKQGFATVPFENSKSNLTIRIDARPDGCPLGNVGVNIPWLAFCSGTYLKREGRIIPLPVATLRYAPDAFAYSDRTQIFDDELGLPRTLDLFTSQSLYEVSVTKFNHDNFRDVEKATLMKWAPRNGILKFHYVVTESTNFLGWNFPTRFEYIQNEPGINGIW